MKPEDDDIVMKKGEPAEELAKRIEAKKGKIKRVLDEQGNVLLGWGYPQSVPSSSDTYAKMRDTLKAEAVVLGWGYPQSIPPIVPPDE